MIREEIDTYCSDVLSGKIVSCEYVKLAVKRYRSDIKNAKKKGFYFDEQAASAYIAFIELLPHVKGQPANEKRLLKLEPVQKFIIWNLFGWKRVDNNRRRFRHAYLEMAKKNAKALSLDTPILTSLGWKNINSINVGDVVFDENGKQINVIGKSEVFYNRDCYKIIFNDGSEIVADADHDWITEACISGLGNGNSKINDKLPNKFKGRIRRKVTTKEILNSLKTPNGINNHSIEICGPIDYNEKQLTIPPYVLGAWIGDGETAGGRITCCDADYEIIDRISNLGYSVTKPSKQTSVHAYGILKLKVQLNAIGVLNNKHIPEDYLQGSISQRMELLRGLMDTDGTISKAGQCVFCTTKIKICDGVKELITSLGFKPTVEKSKAKLYGREISDCYKISFWANQSNSCFHLKRKVDRLRPKPLKMVRSMGRQIIDIVKVDSVPVQCLCVDGDSHLFLAGKSLIPTHNSTLAAAIALAMFVLDGEAGAEIYSAATTADQAGEVFAKCAVKMWQKSDWLQKDIHGNPRITKVQYQLNYERYGSFFKALPGDSDTAEGKNAHCAIIDEYHVHKSDELVNNIVSGSITRAQPLIIRITTAGFNRKSPCYKYRTDCINVLREITHDESLFIMIFTLDEKDYEKDNWKNEEVWPKAHPLWYSNPELRDGVRSEFDAAIRSASKEVDFKTKMLSIWTDTATTWITDAKWMRSAGEVSEEKLLGRECYGGLDLSKSGDFSSLVLLFPMDDGTFQILPYFWLPEERAMNRASHHYHNFLEWRNSGHLSLTDGDTIDHQIIRRDINELAGKFNINSVAYDRAFAVTLVTELTQDGLTLNPFGQGYVSMTAPISEMENLILSNRFHHGGNPVLRWMMSNVLLDKDAKGNTSFNKAKAHEAIDGVVSSAMAIGQYLSAKANPEPEPFMFVL